MEGPGCAIKYVTMADIQSFLIPTYGTEGSQYTNDPDDPGGPTKWGITLGLLKTLKYDKLNDGIIDERDVKALTMEDVEIVIKKDGSWPSNAAYLHAGVAFHIPDWKWTSGNVGKKCLSAIANSHIPNFFITIGSLDLLTQMIYAQTFCLMKANFFRTLANIRPKSRKFIGWWSKSTQMGYHNLSGVYAPHSKFKVKYKLW